MSNTELLDWLEKYSEHFHNIDRITAVQGKFNSKHTSLRDAIRATMQQKDQAKEGR